MSPPGGNQINSLPPVDKSAMALSVGLRGVSACTSLLDLVGLLPGTFQQEDYDLQR